MANSDNANGYDEEAGESDSSSESDYSYDTSVSLDADELAKLGVTGTLKVGDTLNLSGVAKVTSYDQGQDGKNDIGLQVDVKSLKPISAQPTSAKEAVASGIKEATKYGY